MLKEHFYYGHFHWFGRSFAEMHLLETLWSFVSKPNSILVGIVLLVHTRELRMRIGCLSEICAAYIALYPTNVYHHQREETFEYWWCADDANGGETMTHADAKGYYLCLNVALFCIGMNKINHHHIFNVDTLQCAWQEAEGGKGNQLYIC